MTFKRSQLHLTLSELHLISSEFKFTTSESNLEKVYIIVFYTILTKVFTNVPTLTDEYVTCDFRKTTPSNQKN